MSALKHSDTLNVIRLTIDPETLEFIDSERALYGMTRSEFVGRLIEEDTAPTYEPAVWRPRYE